MAVTKLCGWLLLTVVASVLVLLVAPTLVRAAGPGTGYLEVCKASDGSAVTGTFRFTVAAQAVDVPVGACSAALQLPAGVVTVSEEAVPGVGVVDISASPADRLVSASVATRSAQVTVVPGGVASQTLVTFTNRAEVGVLTVCKVAGPGIVAGTNFSFVVAGRAIAVPAGQCGAGGTFPYGSNVTVAEVLEPTTRVSDIQVFPPSRVVGAPNLSEGAVTVTIGPGINHAAFTNEAVPQGLLQICKRSDDASLTGSFTFTVAGQRVDVPVGLCSGLLRVPEGVATVSELPRGDTLVSAVTTSPASRLVQADLAAGSAQVRVVAGNLPQMATVTFTNVRQTGQVKVCKVAGRGVTLGTPFSFTVAGRPLSVPAGSCVLAGTFPLNSVVTVAETIPNGMQVAAITVDPPERTSGAANLANGSVSVVAGPGVTEVMVVNQTVTPLTPTTLPVPTTSVPLVAPTTTVPTSTTTMPLSSTSTIPVTSTSTTAAPVATTSTTVRAAATSTTVVPLAITSTTAAPVATTSTTAPVSSTSTTVVPLLVTTTSTTVVPPATTSTTSGLLTTATTVVPPATSTTIVPLTVTSSTLAPNVTTTTVAPCITTTTAPISGTATTLPSAAATTTTAPISGTSTTLSSTTTTAPMSSTTTTAPSSSSTTAPTSATTIAPVVGTAFPCAETPELSTTETIVGRLVERATSARLALTGSDTSLLLAAACAALLLGTAAVSVARGPQRDRSSHRSQSGPRRTAFPTRSRFALSGVPRFGACRTPRHRARQVWRPLRA